MSQTSDKVIAKINGVDASGEDDNRDHYKTGTKKEWSVHLFGATAEVQTDVVIPGTSIHVEVFSVSGKWSSHVRYDNYVLGALIDKIWGDDKKPYGTFTIAAKAVDGGVTSDVNVQVDGFNDNPNEYARSHADGLIRSIMSHIQNG
jgi:hypothetical protein